MKGGREGGRQGGAPKMKNGSPKKEKGKMKWRQKEGKKSSEGRKKPGGYLVYAGIRIMCLPFGVSFHEIW